MACLEGNMNVRDSALICTWTRDVRTRIRNHLRAGIASSRLQAEAYGCFGRVSQ